MERNRNNYCVIMAGGVGSRFWPLSRKEMPKQFLDILGTGKSFIRATFERFSPLIPTENFLVVTSERYKDLVLEHLPELNPEQILLEPLRRNTAPCIAYAANRIARENPRANMVVTPSDHLITGESEFHKIILEGLDFVNNNDKLLTIGIRPTRPETGYGYIQIDTENTEGTAGEIRQVKTFTEKPNLEMAQVFVDSGEFFWNSGIFVWSIPAILKAFGEYLPDIHELFTNGSETPYGTLKEQEFIDSIYPSCMNISIDYGIMEKSPNVYVRCGEFGWSDIGTWGSLYQHAPKDENGNVLGGRVLAYETNGTIVELSKEKIAVIEGLEDYLVVEQGNALLICRRDNEQKIRNYVEDVKYRFGKEFI